MFDLNKLFELTREAGYHYSECITNNYGQCNFYFSTAHRGRGNAVELQIDFLKPLNHSAKIFAGGEPVKIEKASSEQLISFLETKL